MIIRVDKCITFGIKKSLTKPIHFQPTLLISNNLVPRVEKDESFRYLGKYFDFGMSNDVHKKELIKIVFENMAQIVRLPLHPRKKIKIVLAKIS